MVEEIITAGGLKVALGIRTPREDPIRMPQEEIISMLQEATILFDADTQRWCLRADAIHNLAGDTVALIVGLIIGTLGTCVCF